MLDATGKYPDGLLEGNFNALGSYSECIEIEAFIENGSTDHPPKDHTFSGKFGGVNKFGSFPNFLHGVCLPSTCTEEDFYAIVWGLNGMTDEALWIPHMSVANETYKLEGGDILMM